MQNGLEKNSKALSWRNCVIFRHKTLPWEISSDLPLANYFLPDLITDLPLFRSPPSLLKLRVSGGAAEGRCAHARERKEGQIPYDVTYVRNRTQMVQMTLSTKQKQTHRHREQTYSCRGRGGGINWEIGIDRYTVLYIKQITSERRELYSILCKNLYGKRI